MKSRSKIEKQLKKKTNDYLVETIIKSKKAWLWIGAIISGPRKKRKEINLNDLDKEVKEGETVVVPGKVLGQGDISKKVKVIALSFSKAAEEKLKNAGCETVEILEEIKKNPEAKGLRVLK